ncbi:tagaturonate reductase [Peribacillus loiseleuriae]|uniref:tagaturonate reductase n=1 Tax=Peribacillus loiseleuriae TaxID=1679170 RepID=UPI0038069B3A
MEKLNRKMSDDFILYPEKILQFGEGNFLRAFVDWQIDILNKETDFNGSVVVVQPRGSDKIARLNNQDGLFTLYLQGLKDGKAVSEHMVINSISRGIHLADHYNQYIELAESKDLRFVISNTTEAGIYFEESDKLDDRPQKSFPGKLAAFLYHRFKAFNGDDQKGCIMIPTELIEGNGTKLKEIILQFASLWNLGDAFVNWICEANTFCNSLVDRIVPGFPKDSVQEITEELGYEDELLVVGEQYHQWVIEGPKWIEKEFPIDKVNLNTFFVDDLNPYRVQKVRILNGAHTAMMPVAYLSGLDTVAEAVCDEVVGEFVQELIFDEILPTLDFSQGELRIFANDVLNRFRNPFIKHYLISISMNSISKFKTRNLPTLLDYVETKKELPRKMIFALSSLLYFYQGKRNEEVIPLADDTDVLQLFKELWGHVTEGTKTIEQFVKEVLSHEKLWGMNLNHIAGLTVMVAEYLQQLNQKGMKQALETLVKERSVK